MATSSQAFDRKNKNDVRRLITRALERLAAATNLPGMNTPQAIELLMGTWAHESLGGKYNTQLGGGPARGMWQIEKATYLDVLNRCSADAYRELLVAAGDPDALLQDHFDLLVSNHTLCAQVCRLNTSCLRINSGGTGRAGKVLEEILQHRAWSRNRRGVSC